MSDTIVSPASPENNPIATYFKGDLKSKAKAIKAMCAHCMGCSSELQSYTYHAPDGTAKPVEYENHLEQGFRQAIRVCASKSCPLWAVRPFQVIESKKVKTGYELWQEQILTDEGEEGGSEATEDD